MRRLLLAIALGLSASAGWAQSFLEVINATEMRTTTASNRVMGAGTTFVVGRLRSVLDLQPQQQAFVSFALVGGSASGPDFFSAAGSRLTSASPIGTSFELGLAGAGLLDFGFGRGTGSVLVGNAGNASWLDANFGIVLAADRRSGFLLFEDARLGSDFDYDDLVVRFQLRLSPVAPVPEPSTLLLAVAGLAVLVLSRRRRGFGQLSRNRPSVVTSPA